MDGDTNLGVNVASFAETWIETLIIYSNAFRIKVASFAEAWVKRKIYKTIAILRYF